MSETFRPKKTVLYQGIILTLFSLALTIFLLSGLFFLDQSFNPDSRKILAIALLAGGVLLTFGTMTAFSISLWISYYVKRITIEGTTVTIRTLFQNQKFDFSELQRLSWKVGGGRLLLQLPERKLRFDLSKYSEHDCFSIITLLRDRVPENIQEGWPEFCHRFALPLRDGLPSTLRSDPSAKPISITRKRYDRMAIVVVPMSVIVAITLWRLFNLPQSIAFPLFVIFGWLSLRFHVPREGYIDVRLPLEPINWSLLLSLVVTFSGFPLTGGLRWLGFYDPIAYGIGYFTILMGFSSFMMILHKAERKRKLLDEKAARKAPDLWDKG